MHGTINFDLHNKNRRAVKLGIFWSLAVVSCSWTLQWHRLSRKTSIPRIINKRPCNVKEILSIGRYTEATSYKDRIQIATLKVLSTVDILVRLDNEIRQMRETNHDIGYSSIGMIQDNNQWGKFSTQRKLK